jgi:hypothetical protein
MITGGENKDYAMDAKLTEFRDSKYYKLSMFFLILFFILMMSIYLIYNRDTGYDWRSNFKPSALNLLKGNLNNDDVFNPVWGIALLIPFALIPDPYSNMVMSLVEIACFVYVGRKLKIKPLTLLMIMTLPQTMMMFCNGNLEWLVLLGFIMPIEYGSFLLVLKPQIGIGVILYKFFENIREKKYLKTVLKFAPVSIAMILFGAYYLFTKNTTGDYKYVINARWNVAAWPYGLVIGVVLLYYSVKNKKENIARLSSGFFAPYISSASLSVLLLGAEIREDVMLLIYITMWLIAIFIGR